MPLLSRYKSSSSSSSSSSPPVNQTSSPQANQSQGQSSAESRVCESPLFGIRKQLSLTSASSSQTQQQQLTCAQTTSKLTSAIPQQISKQQIHYAFSIMDANQDGMIDLRDLSQMLANLGVPIDEAILSHLMSTVSKRADHRISEVEFLEWISLFIQIADSSPELKESKEKTQKTSSKLSRGQTGDAHFGERRAVARSSTSNSSLAAESAAGVNEEAVTAAQRSRRGSGSGLALMRSLSSGANTSSPRSESPSNRREWREKETERQQVEPTISAESEARDDLKAAFCVFDLDGDGFITLDEVRAGLKLLGETWTPNELSHLFSKCNSSPKTSSDLNNQSEQQQRISIDDFVQLLL